MADEIKRVGPSRGGRPPIDREQSSYSLCTRLTAKEYDRLVRLANQRDTSVSALVRRLIVLRLP